MSGLAEITSASLTPQVVSRVQLLSRSALHVTPSQLRERYFGEYTVAQISGALVWDLQLRNKPLHVRIGLCAGFLSEHPDDPVSSGALCWHFGLNAVGLHAALMVRERGACGPAARLNPIYPDTTWSSNQRELHPGFTFDDSYWHPLETLHLHVIARRTLTPAGILDRRIFPGVALADIEHHLNSVRLPAPASFRRHGGQLTSQARHLLSNYLRYCQECRQFVTLASVQEMFGLSPNAMSGISAEAGWNKAGYYEFRRLAYRELVGRYSVRIEGADGVRPSLVLVAKHAAKAWRFSPEMIGLNLAPGLDSADIARLARVALPLSRLSGKGSAFEWFEKIPGRKLLYDVLSEQFGVIPRGEMARIFLLTESSFAELLSREKIDPDEWDRVHAEKKAGWAYCLPGLTPAESLDCIHAQILDREGVTPAEAVRLGLLDGPAGRVEQYRKRNTGLLRPELAPSRRESQDLDPLTSVALCNYLARFSAAASQQQVMECFGVDRTCLNRVRRSLAARNGPAYVHWGRNRRFRTSSHFDTLDLLASLPPEEAVFCLHALVTAEAVHVQLDAVLAVVSPWTSGQAKLDLAARCLRFLNDLSLTADLERAALVRAYFKQHPGVPLRPVAQITGLTARRIESLLPRRESGAPWRRAEWTALFSGSDDSRAWAALLAHSRPRPRRRGLAS